MGGKKLLLVDAYSQIYRGFYAIRALTNSKGEPSNAVFAMAKLLLKLEKEYGNCDGAFVFDKGKCTKRLALSPAYKANRPPMPEELRSQISSIRLLVESFGWKIVESEGSEADDLMGAFAAKFSEREVFILSSDKDVSQVITRDGRVKMLVPSRDGKGLEERGWEETIAKFGVPPERIVDYLSLIGDSSDNIPGVEGIGPKTSCQILSSGEPLAKLLEEPSLIAKDSWREKLTSSREILEKNRALITLDLTLPGELNDWKEEAFHKETPRKEAIRLLVSSFELKSILAEVEKLADVSGEEDSSPCQMEFSF